ncbi:D-aminoacyl-tRNA deacylase [Halomarina rubra]|uniref:D-aminoacyl-tRNA deacylase n=1 Tax=Halomarina rubra TaxID=2071873 RepID=A0ABD6ARW2_9EURY
MLGIVVSRADSASERIGTQLLDLADWEERADETRPDAEGGGTVYRLPDAELRVFDDLHIYLEAPDTAFDAEVDCLAVVSRHAGDTGPLLTAHPTGNVGVAEYGGEAGQFARAAPGAQKAARDALDRYAPEGYDVGMECTHHGPTDVETPSLFVELGSDEEQWADDEAARAVARATLDLRGVDPTPERTLVGFGGGHYVPRFERVVRETDWAVGHVAADWGLDDLPEAPDAHRDVFRRAFERSGATRALVDGERPFLREQLAALGYEVVSETWARETTGVPLDLVERLERDVTSVEDGLRFGALAREDGRAWGDTDLAIRSLPDELLAEATGIDRERTLELVRERSVAVGTDEGGTRLAGPVVVPAGDASEERERIEGAVDALVAVLESKFDAVEREDGRVVVTDRAFDPALARERGVEEGPAFGRLSNGQDVSVDGTVISAADVHRERRRSFSVDSPSDERQTSAKDS